VTTLIAVTIPARIDMEIAGVITMIQIILRNALTTIVTVIPTTILTTIVTSFYPHPTSLIIVGAVTRATTAIRALARPEAVLLAPNMMNCLLNVGESCLGGDMSAQER